MMDALRHSLLGGFETPDEVAENRMIDEIDAVLNHPPRVKLPAGEILFRQNDQLDGIWILLSGKVSLYQIVDNQEVVFHSQTAGRIIGLLALARKSRSFFNCRAVTDIELLRVSLKDLDRALQESESLRGSFITVLLRSMARRNRRLVELQTEVLALNTAIARERDQVARTLDELQKAQALLVESEKMATLGQLAAGVAHELNNPVAAIARAASFLREDLLAVAITVPPADVFSRSIRRALEEKPRSTREQREMRARLQAESGDEAAAERLAAIGIQTIQEFEGMAAQLGCTGAEALDRLELYHQMGGALRNIDSCAERIAALVKSLRAYIHADGAEATATDVREGIEDTLRLFANRLRGVEVERHYHAVPLLMAHPGELNQVWTNLIANALDAMRNQGHLIVETARDGEARVVIRIIDNGPGISPEHLGRIFDMRFTTRKGRVEFGLGLGLSISRNIVLRHGGDIDVQSRPGRTEFIVSLPVHPPAAASPTAPTEKLP